MKNKKDKTSTKKTQLKKSKSKEDSKNKSTTKEIVKKVVTKSAVGKTSAKKFVPKKSMGTTTAKTPVSKKSAVKVAVKKTATKTPSSKAAAKLSVLVKPSKKTQVKKPLPQKSSETKKLINQLKINTNTSEIKTIEKNVVQKNKKEPIKIPIKKHQGENILKIYLVVKVAIFNHDIFGAYSKKSEAIEVANKFAFDEVYGEHTFDVVEIPLNSLKNIHYNDFYGQSCYQETVFSSSKKLDAPVNESMLWGVKSKN